MAGLLALLRMLVSIAVVPTDDFRQQACQGCAFIESKEDSPAKEINCQTSLRIAYGSGKMALNDWPLVRVERNPRTTCAASAVDLKFGPVLLRVRSTNVKSKTALAINELLVSLWFRRL